MQMRTMEEEEDEPIDKMRKIRNKMAESRRREDKRDIKDAMMVRMRKNKPSKWNGQK